MYEQQALPIILFFFSLSIFSKNDFKVVVGLSWRFCPCNITKSSESLFKKWTKSEDGSSVELNFTEMNHSVMVNGLY